MAFVLRTEGSARREKQAGIGGIGMPELPAELHPFLSGLCLFVLFLAKYSQSSHKRTPFGIRKCLQLELAAYGNVQIQSLYELEFKQGFVKAAINRAQRALIVLCIVAKKNPTCIYPGSHHLGIPFPPSLFPPPIDSPSPPHTHTHTQDICFECSQLT